MTLLPPPAFPNLRSRLAAGEATLGAFAGLDSPAAAEFMARAGFDWLIVDLEHGVATEATLLAHLYAISTTPCAAIVRPQSFERLRIGRALDLGAHGIMAPRVDTADQAREIISFLRYPPTGIRGLALPTRGAGLMEHGHADIATVGDGIVGIIQVESPAAVAAAGEIAAIDGVDVLFVGPTDLSHALGVPGRFDDAGYLDALRTVVAATEAAGKTAGILLRDLTAIPAHLELGFRFLGLGADNTWVAAGARGALEAGRAAIGR
jgi:2-dehydro-3-deoxyglucarate aldolase/4-hydroxy-2-oxoheptanedioate aldolase